MINKKTVFILGAGSSAPFGFPLGMTLLKEIVGTLKSITGGITQTKHLSDKLLSLGFSIPELAKFTEHLVRSQKSSIDSFLEHRPEFIKLGKILITYVLLKYENLEKIYSNPDWYFYLWNKMNKNFQEFNQNQVSFITFNYDRTLETYLLNSMIYLFDKTDEECYDKLKSIPIVHVHGKLGKTKLDDPINYTEFGEEISEANKLLLTSENIKIIHEDFSKNQEFQKAHSLISDADQIIILGLGYDETNLERLMINDAVMPINGSSFGLTLMECKTINIKFSKIQLSPNFHHGCLEFLRQNVILE